MRIDDGIPRYGWAKRRGCSSEVLQASVLAR